MPNVFDAKISKALAVITKKPSVWNAVGIFIARYLIFILGAIAVSWIWQNFEPTDRLARIAEIFITTLLAWIITFAIEYVVNRPRPYNALGIKPLSLPAIETPSFPSAHATIAFAIAGLIFFYSSPLGIVLLIIAALVALSRVFVGVHYMTDVIAGAIIGFLVSWAVYFVAL